MLGKYCRKYFMGTQATRFLSEASLKNLGINNRNILRNLSTAELYEISMNSLLPADPSTPQTTIASTGAMVAYSGHRMGRSPTDKRVVLDDLTKDDIWWGDVNMPIPPSSYKALQEMAIDYLNTRPRLYVVDGYGGWDPKHRIRFRVFCTRAYHALFMKNMMIRPTEEELKTDFAEEVDYYIFNAGEYPAPSSANLPGISENKCCVSVNLTQRTMTILGTQYAGEMKKGIFGIMNYLMPKKGIVSLHTSANEGPNGDTTLLFGLSGTGKTTLSADPKRKLIGDDEHCWSNDGIFNIEGGCYAKCINLTEESEPDIYRALKFGAILENVTFNDPHTREVNFFDKSLTENTRASYPLEHIPNCKIPAMGGHPKNIIFLTCDSFGVLPPVAELSIEQAMYHFMSGYTAKVAGTEIGIKEPVSTFSTCFGAAFLPLHPNVYGEMLAEKIKKFGSKCWLVNTGWTGGKYGVGKRMSLKYTRKIIDAIHEDTFQGIEFENFPTFNFNIPKECPGVPSEVLNPKNTWADKADYDRTLNKLASEFVNNFKTFEDKASQAVIQAGPQL